MSGVFWQTAPKALGHQSLFVDLPNVWRTNSKQKLKVFKNLGRP